MKKSEDSQKFVAYVRKAASLQKGQGLRSEQRALRKISEKRSLRLEAEIAENLPAQRAGTRSGFNRMIGLIEDGKVDAILCQGWSVLTRNPVEAVRLIELMKDGRLKEVVTPTLVITKESLENNGPSWLTALETNSRTGLQAKKSQRPKSPAIR